MTTLNKKFLLMAKAILCTVLIAVGGAAYAQLNVQDIGAFVAADEAQEWMANFEFENPDKIFGHLYGKQTIREILAQEGAEGLKIFNGMDENGVAKLVYYAANENGEELGRAYDTSMPCPPFCGDPDDDQYAPSQDIKNIGGPIEQSLAEQWIKEHRANRPSQIQSATYGSQIINSILDYENVNGLYFAQAIDLDGRGQILLVAADQNGTLLMNHSVAGNPITTGGALLSASK
ncbi:MAG: hypothetical protein ACR2MX_13445 [Cyclobacteriaceae bacterium]